MLLFLSTLIGDVNAIVYIFNLCIILLKKFKIVKNNQFLFTFANFIHHISIIKNFIFIYPIEKLHKTDNNIKNKP